MRIIVLFNIGCIAYHSRMSVLVPCIGTCIQPDQVAATVQRDILHHRLLHGVSCLGLAVSGGADSVALFHLMLPVCRKAGIMLTVLHLNHGLRAESEEEAYFVKELADSAGVPFLSENANLGARISDGVSLEMAARAARMAFFNRIGAAAGLDAIATGHQANDVAETLLLRLARGAGAAGLSGLRPVSRLAPSLDLIRPLLSISGSALRGWLTQQAYVWREDKTNKDETIPRNFVRNTLLPHLERTWHPDLSERLCQSAEALREDDALLESLARHARETVCPEDTLSVPLLKLQPVALQRRILRKWLFQQGLAGSSGFASVLNLLARCQDSRDWQHQLSGKHLAICHNDVLIIRTQAPAPDEALVPIPGHLRWDDVEIVTEASRGVLACSSGVGCYPATCTLSEEALASRGLRVRARLPGDRISPTGLSGSKKVHDLFVDEKVPKHRRDHIPLFVCGDEVVWIPGYRVARSFSVQSASAPSIRITVRPCDQPE